MQGFHWGSARTSTKWYQIVKDNAAILQTGGIDAIWLPPPSDNVREDNAGGMGYIPKGWYNLNNSMGSESQLRSLIADLHSKNIKVIADIVVNHRGGETSKNDFAKPSFNTPNEQWSIVKEDGGSGNNDYDPIAAGLKGANDPGNFGGSGTVDLDHTNVGVRNGVIDWLKWLKSDVGFDGFRYDFVHGFHPKYIKEYNAAANPWFSVGELLEGSRDRLIKWLDISRDGAAETNTTLFDFATKSALQNAFNNNNYSGLNDGSGHAPGLIGTHPKFSCTMLDNHDLGPSPYGQDHWVFPQSHLMKGYAYILTHPGIPMIWWPHYFDMGLKDKINEIIKIRKNNGLKSTSVLNIVTANNNLYAAIIDDKVALKLGSGSWTPPGSGWVQEVSGDGYVIWDKGAITPNKPTLTIAPPGGTFATGSTVNVKLTATATSGTPTIYYTTDGSVPTTASASASSTITLPITSDKTIRAFAENGSGNNSDSKTEVYHFGVLPIGIGMYFKPPTNPTGSWVGATPKIYVWKVANGVTTNLTGAWPGITMTSAGNGWYKYTILNETDINVIFNNGSGGTTNQTVDLLNITSDKWYEWDSKGFVLSVDDKGIVKNDFILYPNPTYGTLKIESADKVSKVGVFDIKGALVSFQSVDSNQQIELGNLAPGTYIIKMITEDRKTIFKQIIKK